MTDANDSLVPSKLVDLLESMPKALVICNDLIQKTHMHPLDAINTVNQRPPYIGIKPFLWASLRRASGYDKPGQCLRTWIPTDKVPVDRLQEVEEVFSRAVPYARLNRS